MLQVCSHLSPHQPEELSQFTLANVVSSWLKSRRTVIGEPISQIGRRSMATDTGTKGQARGLLWREMDAMHIYLDAPHIVFPPASDMLLQSRPKRVSLRGWEVQLSNTLRF
jgi:hypothetical protein